MINYLAGLFVMTLIIPLNVFLGKRNSTLQKQLLAFRDTRMRYLNEVNYYNYYYN